MSSIKDHQDLWAQGFSPSVEATIARVQAEAATKLEEVKAQLAEIKETLKKQEAEKQVSDTFSHLASTETVYVKYGNVLGVPDPNEVERLHAFLEELGLKNMNIRFSNTSERILFMMQQRFVAVNFLKGAFVSSTTSYDHSYVEAEKFMHDQRGRKAAKKFGF